MAKQTGSIDLRAMKKAHDQALSQATQHFWFNNIDQAGEGVGAHITEKDATTFIQNPTAGGANILCQSGGILLRNNLDELGLFMTKQNPAVKDVQVNPVDAFSITANNTQTFTLTTRACKNADASASNGGYVLDSVAVTSRVFTASASDPPYRAVTFSISDINSGTYKYIYGSNTSNPYVQLKLEKTDDTTLTCTLAVGRGTSTSGFQAVIFIAQVTINYHIKGYSAKLNIGEPVTDTDDLIQAVSVNGSDAFRVSPAGDIYSASSLTLGGHSSPVGSIVKASISSDNAVSVADESSWKYTLKDSLSIDLTPGVWLVATSIHCSSTSAAGYFGVRVGTYNTSAGNSNLTAGSSMQYTTANRSAWVNAVAPVVLTTDKLVFPSHYNTGASRNVYGYIRAVRIA